MKKLFVLLVLASVVVPMATAMAAGDKPVDCCRMVKGMTLSGETFAENECPKAAGGDCTGLVCTRQEDTEKWGVFCILNVLNAGLNWVFVFLMIFVVILTILGAIDIMNQSDPAKSITGRNKIMMAAVGLLIALIARAVPSLVKAVLGY